MYNYSWHKINSNHIEFVLIYYTGYLKNLFKSFEDIVPCNNNNNNNIVL